MLNMQTNISTPKIVFKPEEGLIELAGESYPENPFEFYNPVIKWIKDYLKNNQILTINIKITYMNMGSVKCIFDIFDILEEASQNGKEVKLNWFYERGNIRSLELAKSFKEEVNITFNIIPLECRDHDR